MNSLSEADIVDVLSKINDLSRGKDIYSLGIVTNIHIKDNNVQITLEVESHRANAFEVIRNKVEKSVNLYRMFLTVSLYLQLTLKKVQIVLIIVIFLRKVQNLIQKKV